MKILVSLFALLCIGVLPAMAQKEVSPFDKLAATAKSSNCNKTLSGSFIRGKVTEVTGNNMPSVGGKKAPKSKPKGASKVVVVYPIATTSSFVPDKNADGFYTKAINVKPIAVVKSDVDGCYQVELPPGKYTVMVLEKGKLFGNILDSEMHIAPVDVLINEMAPLDLVINYNASF